jgi:glycosyltransferase involved in cell wall biosynthesis
MADDRPATTAAGPRPINVLVVASWFPSVEDPAAGRFVADQVEAIAATGAARAMVVTFEPARLSGGARSRSRQAAAVLRATAVDAGSTESLFVAPAWGVDRAVPVCRLVVPEGTTAATGPAHAATHREAVLDSLVERLLAGPAGAPDVIHAHTVYPDGVAAAALAQRLSRPLIITEHSSVVDRIVATPAVRSRYAAALASARVVLAVSEMLGAELRAMFPESASKIRVMPNAVPLELFGQQPTPERVPDELLFVGRLKPSKGIDDLLRAVAIARRERPSIRLRLIGQAPDPATQSTWERRVAELNLQQVVTFADHLDRRDIAEAMARASVFVHPSPRETFGVVAVEALASGTPVVAVDSGGVTEILGPEPHKLGAIVPPDDPQALASAILVALDRRAEFDPAALRGAVERRFGSSWVAERLLVVYREVIAAHGHKASGPEPHRAGTHGGHSEWGRPVVVALDRAEALRRLSPLPVAIRRDLTLVTATEPYATALPDVARVVEVAIDTRWGRRNTVTAGRAAGRARRLWQDPVEVVRRILGRDAGSARALRPAAEAIEFLARDVAPGGSAAVIALDGHDQVAAEPAIRAGVANHAGGIGRYADRSLGPPAPDESEADR